MIASDALERGRESFGRQAWGNAYALLSKAERDASIGIDDLERLAIAAHLIGRDEESADIWARAHHVCLGLGDVPRAVRCAYWLSFGLFNRGEVARCGGWLARARRLLDDGQYDCVERGYLLHAVARQRVGDGDVETAYDLAIQAATVADRFGDVDLATLSRLSRGRALIYLGHVADGVALLDEAMVAVTIGEVSPIAVGPIYCAVIEACQEICDLRRAHEWTAALSHWCASQPDLVPNRGQCLVYRAEIMQLHGDWPDAAEETQRACERLVNPPGQPAASLAFYQRGELHRLCGEFRQAEEAYRQASRRGREPQPGLALLRLVQGQVDAAAAAIRHAVEDTHDRVTRSKMLAAYVEIMLAGHDVRSARAAADELSRIAADLNALLLQAVAAQAQGAVLLAEGDARAALATLRQAWTAWQGLVVPYEAARVRVLIGLAFRELRDADTATMELDAARWIFQQLGAAPDLARVDSLFQGQVVRAAGGLTAREIEVIRLVAAGKTNRAIADDLFLSGRTVDRHVSNILTKLGLSSRSAATAYAYEHDLL
jgi:DNA-binding CsgD family transcriptional regulator/tetratricopeptide (TPR) repeat protein